MYNVDRHSNNNMALLNREHSGVSDCLCMVFARDLLNLSRDILEKVDKKEQWKMFLSFKRKYQWKERRTVKHLRLTSNVRRQMCSEIRWQMCSEQICCLLINQVKELNRNGMELSTVILDLVADISLKNCRPNCTHFLEDIYKAKSFANNDDAFRVFAAFRHKPDFMKLLVNCGYLCSLPEGSSLLRKETKTVMVNFIRSVSNLLIENACSMCDRIMVLLKSFFRYNEDGKFYKRMFLVGIALCAIQHNLNMEYDTAERSIRCLRLYFCATTDPILSIFEVKSVLYASFILLFKMDLFDKYCQEFRNLMPECTASLQLRKLTHLARFRVRQNIKVSELPLPSAIEKLYLPTFLKSFVLGDIVDFPSMNGNDFAKNFLTKKELKRLFFGRLTS